MNVYAIDPKLMPNRRPAIHYRLGCAAAARILPERLGETELDVTCRNCIPTPRGRCDVVRANGMRCRCSPDVARDGHMVCDAHNTLPYLDYVD